MGRERERERPKLLKKNTHKENELDRHAVNIAEAAIMS
jgi:hypothetical protein